jgi:hypothetical protein
MAIRLDHGTDELVEVHDINSIVKAERPPWLVSF